MSYISFWQLHKLQIHLRSAHTRRPAYTLRLASIRHQTLETPLCRFYKVPIPWTQGHPRDPTPTPRKPPGDPPRARGRGGGQGAKGAGGHWEGWANGALWGYSEAIPNGKLFRSQSEWKGHSEWMALPNGKLCHVFTLSRKSTGTQGRKGTQREGGPWGPKGAQSGGDGPVGRLGVSCCNTLTTIFGVSCSTHLMSF